jgi:hypothetical protein
MKQVKLGELPKAVLMELTRMYAQNWQTLDGLWFSNVEAEYGLEAAVRIDLKNWERQSLIEAERIKKVLKLGNGGLSSVLTALSFMSWQLTSPVFECEEESAGKIIFCYSRCPVQEGRRKQGKQEFPCKTMKLTLLSTLARAIEPRAMVKCLRCPPDPHPQEFWCKWELTMKQDEAKLPLL